EDTLRVSPLTVLVGTNGIGKASILESLDLFFNKNGFSKDNDGCIDNSGDIEITVAFSSPPETFVSDEDSPTNFQDEPYFLSEEGLLVVKKVYKRSGLTANNPAVFLQVRVPNKEMLVAINETNPQLKKRIKGLGLEGVCDQTINATMRIAIYNSYMEGTSQQLSNKWAPIQKRQAALDAIFPYFALFKSDRLNSSKDTEVSEPVKYAIQSSVKQLTTEIEPVITRVTSQIQDILNRANTTLAESFGDTCLSLVWML
ncbi:MAG: AAA family ATPase, partial [Alphaproteobacteria bacterium]|nr:AAA family ATPase [Alphaproteobacteria bacterium]